MKEKQKAFLTLYEPVHERFERFCRARVYNEMDFRDLMNDSLLVAYEKFDSLKSKEAFLSFLFSICVRVLGNYHQKKRESRIPEGSAHLEVWDRNANPQSHADVHYLYEGLAKLSADQRESIILFEISGFSIQEISVIQNASESAVKQRLKRGREKLMEILTYESSLKIVESHG
ncbi:RNA polymerase sigma factor [Fluviicola taffensis]|uniref:RNA polymerase, sigma-24 subunit, ECF subfamily n=1 Tax=Fluviicola taffensis (strain DSM 16823 / NCIMB 13979 / RW262) TaxID=755732 RepID=F2IDE0_FLUTR|nr:RNA polymerase sigma factor [Fluviicola taffensis]AEA42316.1 RNA polymerase, sigma-24 subunit, ECF subfamily [Fluviicola taffensis DSM 16823]